MPEDNKQEVLIGRDKLYKLIELVAQTLQVGKISYATLSVVPDDDIDVLQVVDIRVVIVKEKK